MAQTSTHPIARMRDEFALFAIEHAKYQSDLDAHHAEVTRTIGVANIFGDIDAELARTNANMDRCRKNAAAAKPGSLLEYYQSLDDERRVRHLMVVKGMHKQRQQIDARRKSVQRIAKLLESMRGPLVQLRLPALIQSPVPTDEDDDDDVVIVRPSSV